MHHLQQRSSHNFVMFMMGWVFPEFCLKTWTLILLRFCNIKWNCYFSIWNEIIISFQKLKCFRTLNVSFCIKKSCSVYFLFNVVRSICLLFSPFSPICHLYFLLAVSWVEERKAEGDQVIAKKHLNTVF